MQEKHQNLLKKWGPLIVLSLALAIIIIDTTLLNVSFGYLIRDLKTDIQSLQWVITAYSLTLAALTITGGRLGDLFGRKRMFMLGAAIFAVGSFIASESHSVGMMISGESIIEGIGAALMMPATASLLVSTYRGRDRAIAMGTWGGIAAAASAVGPILGGFLTTNYSWRWGFRINIFVVAILLIFSFVVQECHDEEEKPRLDFVGVILSSFGLLALVFGIIESSTYGWWKAKEVFNLAGHTLDLRGYSIVPYSLLLGVAVLAVFFWWEAYVTRRGETPLVSLKLFSNRQFSSGALVTAVMALGQTGLIFSLPIFFQAVRGLDAFHTGLALLPMSLAALITAPLSAVLSRKVMPKRLIQAGLLFSVIASFIVRSELRPEANPANFIPGMILYGISLGLVMAQLTNVTLSAVSVSEAGEASGVSNTFRQIGSSLGSAIIGAALLTALSTNLVKGIDSSSVIPKAMKNTIAQSVSSQTSNVEFGGGAQIESKLPAAIKEEIISVSHSATTDANKLAVVYAGLFTALGFLVSFGLPNQNDIETSKSAASN